MVTFATKTAVDAPGVTADDVKTLTDQGLTAKDVADIIFAVGARAFFATVLDAAGAQADQQLGATFDAEVRSRLAVGRPFAEHPGYSSGQPGPRPVVDGRVSEQPLGQDPGDRCAHGDLVSAHSANGTLLASRAPRCGVPRATTVWTASTQADSVRAPTGMPGARSGRPSNAHPG